MAPQENPNLKHVETKKQTVDKKAIADALAVQQQFDAKRKLEQPLSPLEFTVLSVFQKKRLLLDKIWIIVSQSRTSVGGEPISRKEVQEILATLCKRGYLEHIKVDYEGKINDVFLLTEKGHDEIV